MLTEQVVKDPVDRDDVSLGTNTNYLDEEVSERAEVEICLDEAMEISDILVSAMYVAELTVEIPPDFHDPYNIDD